MLVNYKDDEKLQSYLASFAEGLSREEIADKHNVQWKSIDMYFRRRGYKWDNELHTYVVKEESSSIVETVPLNTKAAQIVRLLDVKHPNIRQTANKMGFESIDSMGDYMKSNGYFWNDDLNNYEFQPELVEKKQVTSFNQTSEYVQDERAFLNLLMQHKDRLLDLLATEQQLNTYRFRGNKVNKTLTLTSGAVTLLEDYNKEFNITQRQIVESALAEFFERHGYSNQLKTVTI
ncbi:hypothetical protein [Solibacillus sp. FSL K6-1554]|uniref:hypothetical protein n=1 Tax=Solibacillus sp. FSL K6-1554 TaxID=2921472 RepID=UPI0030F8D923